MTESRLLGNPDYKISNVADLETATPDDASFLANPRYAPAMQRSQAGVIFVGENTAPPNGRPDGRNFLIAKDPSVAFQIVIEAFYGRTPEQSGFEGIHSSAVIHPTSQIGKDVTIGPCVVIDKDVVIGDNTTISASCYVGPLSTIGNDCFLHPRVTIRERCHIGNRVILQPGAVIGSCGFGYITDKQGHHIKLNQVGNVVIEDDVEIGANTTIDRARFKTTKIGRGTKIDNLVQIAHAVVIGEDNIIVAQSGIAGSTSTGRHVVVAGQAAIAGHLKIGSGITIAAKSGVTKSLDKPGKYGGFPAVPLAEYNRNNVFLRNIEEYALQLKALQARLSTLETAS